FCWAAVYSPTVSVLFVSLVFISLLVIVFITDVREQLIPDRIVFSFAALFVALRVFIPFQPWNSAVIGAAASFLLLFLIAVVSRGGMGGGDIKLFTVIGFVLGIQHIFIAFFIACLS